MASTSGVLFRFHGVLNVDALRHAVDTLVKRLPPGGPVAGDPALYVVEVETAAGVRVVADAGRADPGGHRSDPQLPGPVDPVVGAQQELEPVGISTRSNLERGMRTLIGALSGTKVTSLRDAREVGRKRAAQCVPLEAVLRDYAGALIFVSHDRAFVQSFAERVVEVGG